MVHQYALSLIVSTGHVGTTPCGLSIRRIDTWVKLVMGNGRSALISYEALAVRDVVRW